MINFVRIDHRLLHGQVAFTWTKFLGTNRVIIIDDNVVNDEFQKMSLRISKPPEIKLNVFSVDDALSKMDQIEKLNEKIMILFKDVDNALRFCKGYPKLESINYGGIPKRDGAKTYSPVIYLDEEQQKQTQELIDLGIEIYMQQVPTSSKEKLEI